VGEGGRSGGETREGNKKEKKKEGKDEVLPYHFSGASAAYGVKILNCCTYTNDC